MPFKSIALLRAAGARGGPLYPGHVETSLLQRLLLAGGSAAAALTDPWRADMVATNGEVTGTRALAAMHDTMASTEEGRRILRDRPDLSTSTVDFEALRRLPENSLGHCYASYTDYHGISPDDRSPVEFVDDEDLAFVMLRYRQTHDLTHAVLDLPTNLVGEVAVKWVEAAQTGLPMCVGGALLAPGRFTARQARQFRGIRPWVVDVALNARPFYSVYYEERWEQDMDEFRREMKFDPLPSAS